MKNNHQKKLIISLIKSNNINNNIIKSVYKIIKKENHLAIISHLNFKLIKKFINLILKSKDIYFFILIKNNETIGYIILSKNPNQIFDDAKEIKKYILYDLLKSLKLITILNLVIKLFNIDKIFFSKKKYTTYNKTLNLSYLAIKGDQQSKGMGKYFVLNILKIMKKKFNKKYVTVDTKDPKTMKFYQRKCNFKYFSKKIELFKFTKIYSKKI
jgi:hypothetical protein